MAGGRNPGPICQVSRPVNVVDGTLCRAPSPNPGPIGAGPGQVDVSSWDVPRKPLEAARRAAPKLPAESREQFAALFSPVNIAITSGVFAAWGASHLIGVGEAADLILLGVGAVTIGSQVVGAARDITNFVSIAGRARTESDLDRAATHLARAVVTIGITAFVALVMRLGSRLVGRVRMSARAGTAGGGAIVPPAGEGGPWWRAYNFGDDWPGTAVPRGFIMETGGRTFRVTVNATEHMAEYAARSPTVGQLRNPGVWPTSPGAQFAEVDYPLSSLAGALEQAALKYGKLPPQRFPLERFGNWELGIDTRATPWVVEHAVPMGR
jgi:hypothetical protein